MDAIPGTSGEECHRCGCTWRRDHAPSADVCSPAKKKRNEMKKEMR